MTLLDDAKTRLEEADALASEARVHKRVLAELASRDRALIERSLELITLSRGYLDSGQRQPRAEGSRF